MKKPTKTAAKAHKRRVTGFLLRYDDYAEIYLVSRKTIKQWVSRGYDLDNPRRTWMQVFTHAVWPKTFPTARGDHGNSWLAKWTEKTGGLESK